MRTWKIAAAASLLAATAAFATGAPSAEAGTSLIVKRFLTGRLEDNTNKFVATGGRGTTNVFRDNVIMFVFSAPVAVNTVNDRTAEIGVPSGNNLFIEAKGTFYQYVLKEFDPISATYVPKRNYRNRIIFDPTSRNLDAIYQTPYGFLNNSTYTVTVPGIDEGNTKTVKTPDGSSNQITFRTTFKTSNQYLQDYTQPSIVKVEAVDAPGVPLDGRTNVNSRADIVAFFSEAMLPAAFDTATTFRVYNASVGRYVTGTIRPSPDGLSFTFRPAFGYGRGPSNIQVTLTAALTDRSSNVLNKGITVNFVSQFDPYSPSYNELTENFNDKVYEDTTYTAIYDKALWNRTQANPTISTGQLQGWFANKSFDINTNNVWIDPLPWYSAQARTQMRWSASDMGNTARTVSGFGWHAYYTTAFAATYQSTTVQMGHNTSGTMNTNWTGSYSDTPVSLFSGSYTPSGSETVWITGPAFTKSWPYNGRDSAILEIATNGSGSNINYWLLRNPGNNGTSHVRQASNATPTTFAYTHDVRFYYLVDKTEAQSKWYDTGVPSPSYLAPILTETVPAGTAVIVVFQGAKPDPITPGQIDGNSLTAWTSDPLADLGGYRYIRFHVDMQSNLGTSTNPLIEAITMPFIYY